MTNMANDQDNRGDSYNLRRFVEAHEGVYAQALSELKAGRKRTHWMWYIFPQLAGLGSSSTAQFYAISGLDEAKGYLAHPILGPRLRECAQAVVAVQGRSAEDIFDFPDDLKLRSCATLFACVLPAGSVFQRVLEKYFGGKADAKTLELLGM